MDYKVIFKDTFIADLDRIVRRIAADNPIAAQNVGELAIRMAETLNIFPERYPRVRQRPYIRRFIVKKYYKVFYRILPDCQVVEVLRCWDGRRGSDPILP